MPQKEQSDDLDSHITFLKPQDAIHSLVLQQFLTTHEAGGLLIRADLTPPLLEQVEAIAIVERAGTLTGAGLVYNGFHQPVCCLATTDIPAAKTLIKALERKARHSGTWVIHENDPAVHVLGNAPDSYDFWLTMDMTSEKAQFGSTCAKPQAKTLSVAHQNKLQSLYDRVGTEFWNAAMVKFGYYFAVEDNEDLLSAVGVDFILEDSGYAHVGNLATLPKYRRKKMASRVLSTCLNALKSSGITRCGLFVEGQEEALLAFYENLGFRREGRFYFYELPPA